MTEWGKNSDSNALLAFDTVISMYIGTDQQKGSSKYGYLLYNLAEKTASHFVHKNKEQNSKDGVLLVNVKIMDLVNTMKSLMEQNKCSATDKNNLQDTFLTLLIALDDIIAQMTIPLNKNLIHYMI